IHVDAGELREHVERNRSYYSAIRKALISTGQSHLEVAYEDVGRNSEQRRILDYLGVPAGRMMLQPATRKVNTSNLRELVANHSALVAALAGSELEAELR